MTLLLSTPLSEIKELQSNLEAQLTKIQLEECKLIGLTLYQLLINSFSEKSVCKIKSFYEEQILSEPVIEIYINGRQNHGLSSKINGLLSQNIFDHMGEAEFTFKNNEEGRLSMLELFVGDRIEFQTWMAEVFNYKLEHSLPVKDTQQKLTKI